MRKKNPVKIWLTGMMAAILFLSVVCEGGILARAAETGTAKEENVYVGLNDDGSVDGIYVVNIYHPEKEMQILDYGKYESVRNLTTDGEISLREDRISFQAPAGIFCYQGNLSKTEIPWEISISCELNGRVMEARELAGKSGTLKIRIHVGKNGKAEGDFYDRYMLRMTVPLDMKRCSFLEAAGASVENMGMEKRLNYDIPAGREKDILITADVLDFEMEAITFRGFPMALDVDPDLFRMEELYDRVDEAADAAGEAENGVKDLSGEADALRKGADGLKDSADSLKEGLESYAEGTKTLEDGVEELADGAGELADGTEELHDGILSLLDGANELRDGLRGENGAAAGARKLAEGVEKLEAGAKQLGEGIGALVGMIRGMGSTEELDGQAELLLAQCAAYGLVPAGDSPRKKLETLSGLLGNMLASGTFGIRSASEEDGEASSDLQGEVPEQESDTDAAEADGDVDRKESSGSTPETEQETESGAGDGPGNGSGPEEENGPGEGKKPEEESDTEEGTDPEESGRKPDAGEETESAGETERDHDAKESGKMGAGFGAEGTERADADYNAEGTGRAEGGIRRENISCDLPDGSGFFRNARTENGERRSWQPVSSGRKEELLFLSDMGENGGNSRNDARQSGQIPGMPSRADLIQLKTHVDQLLGSYMVLEKISARFGAPETAEQLNQLAEGALALSDGISGLADGAGELAEGMERLSDGTGQLADGVSELADGSEELNDGTRELADGAADLFDGSGQLADASNDLLDGTGQLGEGSKAVSDGTKDLIENVDELQKKNAEIRENTGDIGERLDDETDRILRELSGSGYTPVSFVSDKNRNVELVCFFMKTQEIRIPRRAGLQEEEETLTFWQRLLRLFGIG